MMRKILMVLVLVVCVAGCAVRHVDTAVKVMQADSVFGTVRNMASSSSDGEDSGKSSMCEDVELRKNLRSVDEECERQEANRKE